MLIGAAATNHLLTSTEDLEGVSAALEAELEGASAEGLTCLTRIITKVLKEASGHQEVTSQIIITSNYLQLVAEMGWVVAKFQGAKGLLAEGASTEGYLSLST